MKTAGLLTFNTMPAGTVKDALTPSTQTSTLRSAVNIIQTAMAFATDAIAFAVKRDGSRLVKMTGGTLHPLFAAMVTGGACRISYGETGDTTKSRALSVNGNPLLIVPTTPGLAYSSNYGRVARALSGFDHVEHDDSTPDVVRGTPTGILNALSGVEDIDWVFLDQSETGVPSIVAANVSNLGAINIGTADTPLMDLINLDLAGSVGEPMALLLAETGAEIVDIDLPDVPTVTPTGPRLPFE